MFILFPPFSSFHLFVWHYIFIPNALIPSYIFPDTLISQIQSSQMDGIKTPQADDLGYTLRAWHCFISRSWEINVRDNNVVGISAYEKKTWTPLFHHLLWLDYDGVVCCQVITCRANLFRLKWY